MEDFDFRSEFNEKWGALTKRIIRLLSENSRVSVTEMAKELGIKYTIELDEAALGLTNPHVILVKFTKKPDYNEIGRILEGSHIPQVAVTVDGTYDMFLYANAEDSPEYVYWDKTTQVTLSDYKALWQPSDLAFRHLGFFPLRNALLERLRIPRVYKDMLLLLNENSRMSVNEMSKRLGARQNTLNYNFNKLLKTGYIRRFTIVMRSPADVSMMSMFGKYVIAKGFEEDSMSMRREITFRDDKLPLISRCLFSAQLIGSHDFFFVGVYDNRDVGYRQLIKYYKERYKKHSVKVMYGTIGKTILGDFPTRNLDVKKEFNMIKWIPGVRPKVEKPL